MSRKRSTRTDSAEPARKRARDETDYLEDPITPSKRPRRTPQPTSKDSVIVAIELDKAQEISEPQEVDEISQLEPVNLDDFTTTPIPTPTPKRRGRPPKSATLAKEAVSNHTDTAILRTPTKPSTAPLGYTPRKKAADQSARKKSARALIANAIQNGDADSDDDDGLAHEIYASSDDEEEDDDDGDDDAGITKANASLDPIDETISADDQVATTPTKSSKRANRPRKTKSPTPPRDLPPHEQYFVHNKPGKTRTSDNTLASLTLLTHEEYFSLLDDYQNPHAADVQNLEHLHAESFPQWQFELTEGFSLCLYGFGSKRLLLESFAKHIHANQPDPKTHRIIVINGYAHAITMKEILSLICRTVDPSKPTTAQSTILMQSLAASLSSGDMRLTLIINSIDAGPLRKLSSQAMLSQLAAHPQIDLICSADTPDFPLLWDVGIRSAFNFIFHDCTTFAPFNVELHVVDEVNELLGRNSRQVNGRDGVAFVLKSLPENARNLFRLLVGEVLVALDGDGEMGGTEVGVEYRMIYNKAVEEFICTSEMAFRTLLKE